MPKPVNEVVPVPDRTGGISDSDLAYAAGYFDGEGCITWCGSMVRIAVSSGDYWSVKHMADLFGGGLKEMFHNRKSGDPEVRSDDRMGELISAFRQRNYNVRMFRWALNGNPAIPPLRAMFPFLKAKQVEAAVVLQSGVEWGFSPPMPESQREARRKCEVALRSLKGTGRQADYPNLERTA